MCGRYVSPNEASLEHEFNLVRTEWQFPPSYNVAPTQDVPVIRANEAGQRAGARAHWGLIPFWAKGVQPKYSTINATVEKLTDGATWRGRCSIYSYIGTYSSLFTTSFSRSRRSDGSGDFSSLLGKSDRLQSLYSADRTLRAL